MEFWLPVLGFALIVGAGYALNAYKEHRQAIAVKAIAQSLNFSYCNPPYAYLPHEIWQFELFSEKKRLPLRIRDSLNGTSPRRQFKHLIQREEGDFTLSIGDYIYSEGSGKSKRRYRQTVVIIESDKLDIPYFSLAPESVFHKIGKAFGYQDINFKDRPKFSSCYLLRGAYEDKIRDFFHEGLFNFFESQQRISAEGMGSVFIFYERDRAYRPKQWRSLVDIALEAHEQLRDTF